MSLYTQNWDGVTPPALPVSWNNTANFATLASGSATSAPNLLYCVLVGASGTANSVYGVLDTNGGDVTLTVNVQVPSTTGGCTSSVAVRSTGLGTGGNAGSRYQADLYSNYTAGVGQVAITKTVSGAATPRTPVTIPGFAAGIWYRLGISALGTTISASLQRRSDSMWLNASGAWQAGVTTFDSYTDSGVTGAGDIALMGYAPTSQSANILFDDLDLSASGGPPLVGGSTSVGSIGTSAATYSSTGATGGTAPYSFQAQRAPDVSGSPGTYANVGSAQAGLVANQSPAPFADSGLATGTAYWVRWVVTDSATSPASVDETGVTFTTLTRAPLTYYVSSAGSDGAVGTSTVTAWATPAHVNAQTFLPGDTILFRRGDTFAGPLIPGQGGSAGLPITFGAYGTSSAANPIITAVESSHGIDVEGLGYLTFSEIDVVGVGVTTAGAMVGGGSSRKWGVYCHNTGTTTLGSIRLVDVNITGCWGGVFLWADTTSVSGAAGWSGLEYGGSDPAAPAKIHDCLYAGIFTLVGTMSPSLGTASVLHGNLQVHDFKIYNIYADAAITNDSSSGSGIIVGNMMGGVVAFGEIHHTGANNATGSGGPSGLWAFTARQLAFRNLEVHHNLTAGTDGDGIDFDGGCQHCVVESCYSHHNAGAGILCYNFGGVTAQVTDITIRNNVTEANGQAGLDGEIAISSGVGTVLIHHNTCYLAATSSTAVAAVNLFGSSYGDVKVRDNVLLSATAGPLVVAQNLTNVSFAGNLYFSYAGTAKYIVGSSTYTSLAGFRTAGAGAETGTGLQADPLVTAPGAGGTISNTRSMNALLTAYDPSSASPLIDVALPLGSAATDPLVSPASDFHGNRRTIGPATDIGAVEYTAHPNIAVTSAVRPLGFDGGFPS